MQMQVQEQEDLWSRREIACRRATNSRANASATITAAPSATPRASPAATAAASDSAVSAPAPANYQLHLLPYFNKLIM